MLFSMFSRCFPKSEIYAFPRYFPDIFKLGTRPFSRGVMLAPMPSAPIIQELADMFPEECDTPDDSRRTLLSSAAAEARYDLVEILLATPDVDPDSVDVNGRTPLSYVAGSSCSATATSAVVSLLLSNTNVNPDSQDKEGRTPLSYAASAWNIAAISLLLDNISVNPDFQDNKGRTALSYAAETGIGAVVSELLANDYVNPDSVDNSGRTPLSYAAGACGDRDEALEELLLTGRVNPDSPDKSGRTPLSYAVQASTASRCVSLLLSEDKVDSNSLDEDGRTPLSYACLRRPNIIRLLLDHPNVLHGRTPFSWIVSNYRTFAVKDAPGYCLDALTRLLADPRINPTSIDANGNSVLHWAQSNRDNYMRGRYGRLLPSPITEAIILAVRTRRHDAISIWPTLETFVNDRNPHLLPSMSFQIEVPSLFLPPTESS